MKIIKAPVSVVTRFPVLFSFFILHVLKLLNRVDGVDIQVYEITEKIR